MEVNTRWETKSNNNNNNNNVVASALADNDHDGYPSSELEYLSTKAFNHAVDLYYLAPSSSREEDARHWGRKAIELAGLICEEDKNIGGSSSLAHSLEVKFEKWLS